MSACYRFEHVQTSDGMRVVMTILPFMIRIEFPLAVFKQFVQDARRARDTFPRIH